MTDGEIIKPRDMHAFGAVFAPDTGFHFVVTLPEKNMVILLKMQKYFGIRGTSSPRPCP